MRMIQQKFQTRQAQSTTSNICAVPQNYVAVDSFNNNLFSYSDNLSLTEPCSVSRKLVKKRKKMFAEYFISYSN